MVNPKIHREHTGCSNLILLRSHHHRANTKGMLALITLNASFAVYLVMLQRVLAHRPYSFSFFARASTCGCIAVAIVAAPNFAKVRRCSVLHAQNTFAPTRLDWPLC